MSLRQNLSRARSHIIFIIALLVASAYILFVESERGVLKEERSSIITGGSADPAAVSGSTSASRASPTQWRVQFGEFRSAEEAGRQWDVLRSRLPALQRAEIYTSSSGDLVRLEAGSLATEAAAGRVCELARLEKLECYVVAPLKESASAS